MNSAILLIHPPVSKPCEPPAGIAKLTGVLRGNGIRCHQVDANLEGVLFLLNQHPPAEDTWTKRAHKHLPQHLKDLRSAKPYQNTSRYQRAIADLNRLLDSNSKAYNLQITLGNYQDNEHSALNSADLMWAARHPDKNIFYPYFSKRFSQLITEHQPTHVGISLNYLSQATTTFAILGFLKNNYPSIKLVLGGGLITSWLHGPNKTKFNDKHGSIHSKFSRIIDKIIAGPGEEALLRYLNYPDKITPYPPDYTDLPLKDYLSNGVIIPYAAASGCYWNKCTFCPEPAEGNRYQALQPPQVVAELRQLIQQLQPKLIHILDNAISPKLLKELIKTPIATPWYGFARVAEQLCDIEFCHSLKRVGCVMLKLGVESGDQEILDDMCKGVTVKLTSRVLKTLHEAGISTYVYLLFGTPTETLEKARKTLNFVQRHAQCITFLNLAIFNLPIGSTNAQKLTKHSFYAGDLSLYCDFTHPLDWNRKKIRHFLEHEFKQDPAIKNILQRDPPLFTSNHAPLTILAQQG
jgi:hypothetical protein